MADKLLLGKLLMQQGLVGNDILNEALRVQVGGNLRLGKILVRMGALTEDRLAEVLAAQMDKEITDIDKNFSQEVKNKLPRYLCQQYDAIPLKLKNNNILEIAMSDPSDYQAINDLEKYTGNVIEPRLARQSDIAASIARYIPYSLNDFFSPRASVLFTRIAVAISLVLVVAIGSFSYHYIHDTKYGTVSINGQTTIYKNYDLMLGIDKDGTINFLGRGTFATGYYSVSFKNAEVLRAFIASKKNDFSEKQQEWLDWVITKTSAPGSSQKVTSTR